MHWGKLIIDPTAEVAQVVEHGTENAGVDSSSLSLGTTYLSFMPLLPHRSFHLITHV